MGAYLTRMFTGRPPDPFLNSANEFVCECCSTVQHQDDGSPRELIVKQKK